MNITRILRAVSFSLAILTTVSLLNTNEIGRKLIQPEILRHLLDVAMLIALCVGLYAEIANKRIGVYWIGGALYLVLLTIDTIVWFKYFIPHNFLYILHLSIMSLPLPIYLYQIFKLYKRSTIALIGIGLLNIIGGIINNWILNDIYLSAEHNSTTFEQLTLIQLITNYFYYLGAISLATGLALWIFRKRATTE